MVGGLGTEDAANGLVVEELGAAVDEGVCEAGEGDFGGLLEERVSMALGYE